MKKIYLLFCILFLYNAQAQLIVDNTTQTPAQLVQNVLLGNGITVSNVTFNGSAVNANVIRDQVGLFQNGVSTNIGIDSGVILATGKAQLAIGPNNNGSATNATANPLTGDSDLQQLTTNTVRNKAILEFDFIPLGENLSFNFVFASEEYPNFANSGYNDVFGFFLSGPGLSGPFTGGAVNIALIPSSGGTPITINNLNNGTTNNGPCEYCTYYINNTGSGQNPNTGASTIQYNGFTTVLAALSNVQCGLTYHIKLAIANVGDNSLDSAVFLKANSFNTSPLNFPNDYLISNGFAPCFGGSTVLNSGLAATVPHVWTLNNVVIPGATGPTITVTQPGTYCATAFPYGPACPVSDCLIVEFLPPMPVNPPIDIYACPGATYNLSANTPVVLGTFIPDTITYYTSAQNADDFNNPITNLTAFNGTDGQEIWVRVDDSNSCVLIQSFHLHLQTCQATPNPVPNLTLCDDPSNNGTETFNMTGQTAIALGGNPAANYNITYHISQTDANNDQFPINPAGYTNISNPQTIYIRMEEVANPITYGTTSFQLIVTQNVVPTFNAVAAICSGDTLNPLPTTSLNGITGTWSPPINNTATTLYTFTPNTGECATTATMTITVNPIPDGNVSGATTVLQNAAAPTITFTGSGGTAPYTFTYNINGNLPNQTITTTTGNTTSITIPTTTPGTYNVNLVNVQDSNAPACSRSLTGTTAVVVVPIPSATISGSTTVCQNAASPDITFTGLNGTAPYTFTYNINGNLPNQTISTVTGNTVTLPVPTNVTGSFTYNLVSVQDANSTQTQSGSAIVNVIAAPAITTPTAYQVCDDNNDGYSCLFFLHTKDPEITSTGTVTYHETATDAQTGGSPITQNPYCNIFPGTQTLYVRVFDPSAPSCYSNTTLQLIVNPRPIPAAVITDYELCDVNNPGDGIEVFDLHTKDTEIANGLPLANNTVNYYLTQADAVAHLPGTNLPNLYSSASQTIWFNIAANATGCNSVGSLNLVVNPLPTVVAPPPMNACSNGAVMTASFDLTLNNGTITAGVSGMTVTYYLNCTDAQNGTGALTSPYTNISNPQTLCVAVEDNATGCRNFTTLQLNVTQGPTANSPTPLQYCDPNNDGFGVFDLNDATSEIVGGPTPPGVSVSYHETQTDALLGANPLVSPYANITINSQIIWVRVYYTLTGCANYVQLKLNVNPTPVAVDPLNDYHVCDDDYDGYAQFDLSTYNSQVLGSLNPLTHSVTYYSTLSDAQVGLGAIANPTTYINTVANTQTIYIRVEIIATGCYDIVALQLVVDPLPQSMQPAYPAYSLCDNNAPDDYEDFDLQSQVAAILMGQTGMSVTFYASLAAANAAVPGTEIPAGLYTNTSPNVQTLGVVITNTATGCFVVSTMDIRVEPLPAPIAPAQPYIICDADQNGFAEFDLCTLTAAINQGGSYLITYHETQTDAQQGNNDLPCLYTNINPFTQVIWVRAEDPLTHCVSVMAIVLQVDPSPVVPSPLADLTVCDTDANNQNGNTTVDLTVQTPVILAAQAGPASGYTVTYYTTQTAAQAGTGNIINTSSYMASNGQVIWVRVEDNATGCYAVGSFTVIINTPLPLTNPTPLSVCDNDANPNDQFTQFDLTVKDNEITGGALGYTVRYYPSWPVTASSVAIPNPTAYTNILPAVQTLGVEVTSAAGCSSYTTLDIRVLPVPTPNTTPPALPAQCEDSLNSGQQTFDLTLNAGYIANNDPNVTLHYFHSLADATAVPPMNEITTPNAALVGDPLLLNTNPRPVGLVQYVYIAVTSSQFTDFNGQHCYTIVQQPFIINPLPIAVAIGPQQICEEDQTANDGFEEFDLTSYIALLTAGNNTTPQSTYTVSFYTDIAHNNPIANPSAFTNTINPQPIYVTVTDAVTGCSSDTAFDIMVNPKPELTAPITFASCDDEVNDNDGYYLYPLDVLIPGILNGQPASGFTVSFYHSQAEADAGTPAITDLSNYQAQTQTIWIRVEDNTTHCYKLGSFDIIIEQYATPVIETQNDVHTICVNYITNTVERPLELFAVNTTSYLNAGVVTPPNYTYQWYVDGVLIPGAVFPSYVVDTPLADSVDALYTVEMTSTSALGCSATSEDFQVIQSGPAVAATGTTGYTVTSAFSENQVITVTVMGYGTYQYSLDDGPRQDSNVFEHVPLGSHVIMVWDTEGGLDGSCDALVIEQVQTINYPHYFTPNGDGIHDNWNIVGLDGQPGSKIYIFDRFGKLLKQISSTGDGWDGTLNGQQLPSTDYWFTVDYNEDNTTKQFKAHFTLKR